MNPRERLARRASALALACFVLAGLAPSAQAAPPPPPAYTGQAIGQGVVATFAVKPSIFDPLLQTGGPYAEAVVSSQSGGSSEAIAAQVFPGYFAIGAVGCAGLKGWVQATYPASSGCETEAKDTLYQSPRSNLEDGEQAEPSKTVRRSLDTVLNTVLERSTFTIGNMHARALLVDSFAEVRTHDYALRADPSQPPVIAIEDLHVRSIGGQTDTGAILNEVTLNARNVSILNGMVTIGTMKSFARTVSNGETGEADAKLTFADVEVLVNDSKYRAAIENDGIHITEPGISRKQALSLEEEFEETLVAGKVKIAVSTPTEIVDGADTEASIGGLTISVAGTVPVVPVPHELAGPLSDVISQIPTKCAYELLPPNAPHLPLCFGPGVVPGPGNEIVASLSIGNAFASTFAGLGFDFGGGCTTCGGGPTPTTPPTQPDSIFVPGQPLPGSRTTVTTTRGTPVQPSGPLLGVFANMPAGALLWIGVMLLILAVGAALGPSLRHARAG